MTPTVKYAIKVVSVGLYSFLVALAAARSNGAAIGVDQLDDALIAGGLGGLGFAGLAATPLENPQRKTGG